MKRFFLALFAFLTFAGISAPAIAEDNTQVTVVTVQLSPEAQQKIGEVLEVLMVVNKNEVNAANVALKRASHASVKQYARMMKDDHSQNLEKTKTLADVLNIKPMSSTASKLLTKKGKNEVQELQSVPNRRFDKVYMEDMVKGHENVLAVIDNELLPRAVNPRVVEHLQATRDKVAMHLKEAKVILNSL